jgi:hypothetical protein
MQTNLSPSQFSAQTPMSDTFVEPIGFMTSLFGCWHQKLSRPFTTVNESYRVCVDCGAHRKFDPVTLETTGKFYFPQKATVSTQS